MNNMYRTSMISILKYLLMILFIINIVRGNNVKHLRTPNTDITLGSDIVIQYIEKEKCVDAIAELQASNQDHVANLSIKCKNQYEGMVRLPEKIVQNDKNNNEFSLLWDVDYHSYVVILKIKGINDTKNTGENKTDKKDEPEPSKLSKDKEKAYTNEKSIEKYNDSDKDKNINTEGKNFSNIPNNSKKDVEKSNDKSVSKSNSDIKTNNEIKTDNDTTKTNNDTIKSNNDTTEGNNDTTKSNNDTVKSNDTKSDINTNSSIDTKNNDTKSNNDAKSNNDIIVNDKAIDNNKSKGVDNNDNTSEEKKKNDGGLNAVKTVMFATIFMMIGGVMVFAVRSIMGNSENRYDQVRKLQYASPPGNEIKFPPLRMNPLESESFLNINESTIDDILLDSRMSTSMYVPSEESVIPVDHSFVTSPAKALDKQNQRTKSIMSLP